jgi:hypothetical protein
MVDLAGVLLQALDRGDCATVRDLVTQIEDDPEPNERGELLQAVAHQVRFGWRGGESPRRQAERRLLEHLMRG